jgi:calcium-dependent protein kinase
MAIIDARKNLLHKDSTVSFGEFAALQNFIEELTSLADLGNKVITLLILKEIDHPNIVKMYEFFEDEKRYYLVTDICKGGELFDEILQRGKFSERDGAVLMKQVLSCINYCHQNNIVHRDLKPENILLEQNKEFDQIKIIDFGTSLVYEPNKNLDEKLGTPYYIAPDVLNKNYNSKCDIWSWEACRREECSK